MEKEINGTESENSVTSDHEIGAADEQQKVSEETGNLVEKEPDNIKPQPQEEVIDSSESEEQPEELSQSAEEAEPSLEENSTSTEGGNNIAADTPVEITTDVEEVKNKPEVVEEVETKEEPVAEAVPVANAVPSEENPVTETKLVAEASELSKEIESEELIPAEDLSVITTGTANKEGQPELKPDSKKESNHEENSTEEEKKEEVTSKTEVEDSNEVEVEKANETIEEHPVDRHEEDNHHETYAEEDFSKYTKEQLIDVIKQLGKDDNPIRADKVLYRITPFFNLIKESARAEAAKKFEDNGGDPAEFSYKPDELVLRFDANYRLIKDKKGQFLKTKEREKQSNLALAEEVLDKLRHFVDSEESSASFDSFKVIQNEWKAIGDVPGQHSRSLWANYNALIHRFYDQRSIYFELKELDRKKNYDAKVILCERAEALENEPIIRNAIKDLNDLHYDYKHMGPVPRELQEDLWQRFKKASDKIYEKRKDYVAELKTELNDNLIKKQELADEVAPLAEFNSDQIKAWNDKSKQILDLQKRWDNIGGLPKEKAKAVNKKFWSAFKSFFHKKKLFFKQLESEREGNLELKKALVEQAIALQDSTDWNKTANELKALQKQWREIGPVPGKVRNQIYEEFKKACDQFFDNRRAGSKDAEKAYDENLKVKKEIIANIKDISKKADEELDNLKLLVKQYMDVGFVPKKNIGQLKNEFSEAVDTFLTANTSLSDDQKEALSIEMKMGEVLKGENSDKVLYQKEQGIRRQINKIENEVALWTNNLEFFRHSKSADKLRDEFNAKIDKANEELEQLKRKLKAYRTL